MRFSSFKAGQTKHAMCLSFRYCVLHTCDSAIASLQGVSKANEEANQIQAQSKISINCHCEQSEAIYNVESHFLVFRHCEARSNEAIHNIESHFKDSIAKTKGEISDDRLPQPLTRLRNDRGADALVFRHCEARSNEAIHNQTYFKDSIAKTKGEISDDRLPQPLTRLRNDESLSPQKSDIMDLRSAGKLLRSVRHDSLRNLAMTQDKELRNES